MPSEQPKQKRHVITFLDRETGQSQAIECDHFLLSGGMKGGAICMTRVNHDHQMIQHVGYMLGNVAKLVLAEDAKFLDNAQLIAAVLAQADIGEHTTHYDIDEKGALHERE